MNIQTVKNVGDCIPLYLPHSLYLKPYAKLSISVSLPPSIPGKTISNWDVMEKLRQIILPETFSVIKISKSTLEFIRFEAEIEDKEKLRNVLSRLDGRSLKLTNFSDHVKIRAKEGKDAFPMKHDWDSFFRDARNMDEMKPGERPDTIHITNLPVRWFCPRHLENADNVKPSENIFKRIFEKFGDVRTVDIPICDPYRGQMKSHMSGMKTFSFDQDLFFEGYVQFSEYISFVRAMDAFRGMKLIRKEGDKNFGVNIVVNFDKTKHLSDLSTKRRAIVIERLIGKEQQKEDEEKKKIADEEAKLERERRKEEELKLVESEKQRQREEKRKERQLKKLRDKEQTELSVKIREEEKKLLNAQRKLESIRLLEHLFERIKIKVSRERPDIKTEPIKSNKIKPKADKKSDGTTDLRNKLVKRIKSAQEKEFQKYKDRVKRVKEGKTIISKILTARSPSVNSISSNDSILNESDKKKRKKKKKEDSSDSDDSGGSSEAESGSETEKLNAMPQMMMAPHGFPMQPIFNPQTGTWMGMYPYAPMFSQAPMRPNFMPNGMPIRGFRGGRGGNPRFPRGRGLYRGRGSYYNAYESNPHYRHYNKHKYDDQANGEHDYRTSRSRSRSRSSSRSRSRSRSRSYSRSRARRSRSYTKGRRGESRSRSRSHSTNTKPKLVSTRRRTKSPVSSRSRSRSSRGRSASSSSSSHWSHSDSVPKDKQQRKRSWSRTPSRDRSKSKSKIEPRKSRFDKQNSSTSKTEKVPHEVVLEPQKLIEDAEKIKKSVKKHLASRENKSKSRDRSRDKEKRGRKRRSRSQSSSGSVDSAKFEPPKHRGRSGTPEKQWN